MPASVWRLFYCECETRGGRLPAAAASQRPQGPPSSRSCFGVDSEALSSPPRHLDRARRFLARRGAKIATTFTTQARHVLLPTGAFHAIWQPLIGALVLYTAIMTPIQLCFDGVASKGTAFFAMGPKS